MNADSSDAVAGILHEARGRHCTTETLAVWQLGLADLRDHTLADGSSLAEHVAVLLARDAAAFVTLPEFRAAYLAWLPKPRTPDRSDQPELEPAPGDRPASRETARSAIAALRRHQAATEERHADDLTEPKSRTRLRQCKVPGCNRGTTRGDGLCILHAPKPKEGQP